MRNPFVLDVTKDSSVPMTRQIYQGEKELLVSPLHRLLPREIECSLRSRPACKSPT